MLVCRVLVELGDTLSFHEGLQTHLAFDRHGCLVGFQLRLGLLLLGLFSTRACSVFLASVAPLSHGVNRRRNREIAANNNELTETNTGRLTTLPQLLATFTARQQ